MGPPPLEFDKEGRVKTTRRVKRAVQNTFDAWAAGKFQLDEGIQGEGPVVGVSYILRRIRYGEHRIPLPDGGYYLRSKEARLGFGVGNDTIALTLGIPLVPVVHAGPMIGMDFKPWLAKLVEGRGPSHRDLRLLLGVSGIRF